jgi:hypothetical protein
MEREEAVLAEKLKRAADQLSAVAAQRRRRWSVWF